MRRRIAADYQEVNAPQVLDKALWETSGHWGWYRDAMFKVEVADEEPAEEDDGAEGVGDGGGTANVVYKRRDGNYGLLEPQVV